MQTGEFLKRYAWVYLYVVSFFLGSAALLLHAVETAGTMEPFYSRPVIVIDAGHGSPDGGATGASGTREELVNLEISRRLERLLALLGYETIMTRTGPESIATEGDTIRRRKQSDLQNRVALVNELPAAVVVSIHQNHFPDSRYHGPQVFYGGGGEELARTAQTALTAALAPGSRRAHKAASGIYLMERITHPGILVECGFLSNPAEERKLNDPAYQNKIAAILAAVAAGYVHSGI